MAEPQIAAAQFECGTGLSCGQGVTVGGISGPATLIELGDHVQLGAGVRILAPEVRIGDYTVIHQNTTIYGYGPVTVGPCSWIGQNTILNCTAPLTIGRGCTFSAYSTVWTHFSGGDPLEGCRFQREQSATLGEDVWIGVQCSLAPVTIGDKALLLAGSVLTKDMPPNAVWGGNPAADLTAKLGRPYVERSAADKFRHLCGLLLAFDAGARRLRDAVPVDERELAMAEQEGRLTRRGITVTLSGEAGSDGNTVFDVRDRSYRKTGSTEEVSFMRFLLPLVKFYPRAGQ